MHKMSSNRVFTCDYCRKRVEKWIDEQYGKISSEEYEKLKDIDNVVELLKFLPEDFVSPTNIGRLDGCDLDYDFVEDWGDGTRINKDGNLEIYIGCCCDMCGLDFSYHIFLPPNNIMQIINITKTNNEVIKDDILPYPKG